VNQTFTKKEKSLLRQLAGQAWEAELNAELGRLYECFVAWRENATNPFELSDEIHRFHDGTARDLYKRYTFLDPDTAVARALAMGLFPESDVDGVLLGKLAAQRQFFQEDWHREEDMED